jgi:hypothetical protein
MKHEYHEGPEAAEKFERALNRLFRVPKSTAKKPAKPVRKRRSPARTGAYVYLVRMVRHSRTASVTATESVHHSRSAAGGVLRAWRDARPPVPVAVDHNQLPKCFVWTADPDKIIAAVARD